MGEVSLSRTSRASRRARLFSSIGLVTERKFGDETLRRQPLLWCERFLPPHSLRAPWRRRVGNGRRGPRIGPLQGFRLRRNERRRRPEGDPGAQRLAARRPDHPRQRGPSEDRRRSRPPLISMRAGDTGARRWAQTLGTAILPIAALFLFVAAAP